MTTNADMPKRAYQIDRMLAAVENTLTSVRARA